MADGNIFRLVDDFLSPISTLLDGLFYVGTLYGAKRIFHFSRKCLKGIRTYFIPFGRFSRRDMVQECGKWALITGGTSGIGLAFAHEFARRKLNVILVSRSYDDLVAIVSDLQTTYSIQVLGIHADFCLGQHVFQEIEEALQGYEIGILVNNVAIRYDHPQYFALVPHRRLWQLLCVNVIAPCVVSHMILPQMLKRRKGAIINVCSNIIAAPPTPLTAGYTASMAYVDSFSQSIHHENKRRGITVQTLLPCFVTTPNMTSSIFTPTPGTYVQHAIQTLGVSAHTCGYWPHAVQSWLVGLLPHWVWIFSTMYFNSTARKRCLQGAQNGQLFSRKRQVLAPQQRFRHYSNSRNLSDLSLRRTPSPHRRVSTVESPNLSAQKKTSSTTQVRPVLTEENGVTTPQRADSGGSFSSVPSPTVRDNHFTSTPISTANPGSLPQLGSLGFAPGVFPQRSVSASSADTDTIKKSPVLRRPKHSRVLVVPSVATVTFLPQRNADQLVS